MISVISREGLLGITTCGSLYVSSLQYVGVKGMSLRLFYGRWFLLQQLFGKKRITLGGHSRILETKLESRGNIE